MEGRFDYLTGTTASRVSDMFVATPILGGMGSLRQSWGQGILPSGAGGLSAFLRVGSAEKSQNGVPPKAGHGVDRVEEEEGELGGGCDASAHPKGEEEVDGEEAGAARGGLTLSMLPATPQMKEPAVTLKFPANSLTNGRKAAPGNDEGSAASAPGAGVASMLKSRLPNPFGARRWFGRTPSADSSMQSTDGGKASMAADAIAVGGDAAAVVEGGAGAEGAAREVDDEGGAAAVVSPRGGRRRGRLLEGGA